MLLRARAPLRISFAGGTTDMPFYYTEHRGAVLVSTINRYVLASLRPRDDGEIHIRSLDFGVAVKYRIDEEPIYDGILDIAKAAVQRLFARSNSKGMDLFLQSDAPAGSGLGGSATLTAAILGALARAFGVHMDNYELAELAYAVERLDLRISGGKQDQYAAVFGGFNLIEFSKDGVVVNPLRIPSSILNDLECHLLLCYTGKTRLSAGLIDRQQEYFRQARPQTLEGLHSLRQLAYDMKDLLLRGRLDAFAEALNEAWVNKLKIDPDITDSHIDELYDEARKLGAISGKLLGAGGGGYLLLFCEVEKKRIIRERLEQCGGQFTDFSFENEGLQVWESACR
jgi:D-glycero-alpha-D-manno-heptose-7-phosphate kinase